MDNRIIILIALIACLTGCKSVKKQTDRSVQETITVEQRIIERDTVIKVVGGRVSIRPVLSQLREGTELNTQSGNAKLRLIVVNDTLNASCECDTLAIAAKLRDKELTTNRQKSETVTETVYQSYIPQWIKVLASIGGLAIVGLAVKLYLKFKTPFNPF